LRALSVPPGAAVPLLLPALERVLAARDPAMVAVPDDREPALRALRVGSPIDDDVALVVTTSGTTGAPKGALLTAAALTASASATHDRLGGPGSWLLVLPPYHIAGIQVLVRSVLAGTVPVELDISAGFDIAELPSAVRRLGSGRRYTSLVAAQLAKALADPAAAAALAELDAVLIGGGPAPRPILEAAATAGITVVRTYGMSETAGGCVYDGVPLDGVRLRVLADGRVAIGGATLAKGYRNPVVPDPFAEPGWFRTDDLGVVDDAGVLTVLGRADDAISTGGLTVLPQPVEAVLCTHPTVGECAVFGLADERLGQRVVAAVVVRDGCDPPTLDTLREHVTRTLDATAAPRELHVVNALPRRGIGKVDRAALVRRFGNREASITDGSEPAKAAQRSTFPDASG
jgi:o-succinylbenzoate---CoA ligase